MSISENNELLQELKVTNKILLLFFLNNQEFKTEQDKIGFLNKSGFSNEEISNLLGKSQNYITTALGRIEKKENK